MPALLTTYAHRWSELGTEMVESRKNSSVVLLLVMCFSHGQEECSFYAATVEDEDEDEEPNTSRESLS